MLYCKHLFWLIYVLLFHEIQVKNKKIKILQNYIYLGLSVLCPLAICKTAGKKKKYSTSGLFFHVFDLSPSKR